MRKNEKNKRKQAIMATQEVFFSKVENYLEAIF